MSDLEKRVKDLTESDKLTGRRIYLFGCCNPTEKAIRALSLYGHKVEAILDNNPYKIGTELNDIPVVSPASVVDEQQEDSTVLIATRFFAEMKEQLDALGYKGSVLPLTEIDPYSYPSLDQSVISEKNVRLKRGKDALKEIDEKYAGVFRLICPFGSLGDVVNALSYYPYYAKTRRITNQVILVTSRACAQIAGMYGYENVVVIPYIEMSELVQYVIWSHDENSFIAHNDKPYVIDLADILKKRLITHEKIYCCGVFGLPMNTVPVSPEVQRTSPVCSRIKQGRGVVLSPYANSVTLFSQDMWKRIADKYIADGYEVYTNVFGSEQAVDGTFPVSPDLDEMKSVVEAAGIFIGIRSGLCDVIRTANCKKTALYPNSYYSTSKWKLVDFFNLPGWENIEINDEKEKLWII